MKALLALIVAISVIFGSHVCHAGFCDTMRREGKFCDGDYLKSYVIVFCCTNAGIAVTLRVGATKYLLQNNYSLLIFFSTVVAAITSAKRHLVAPSHANMKSLVKSIALMAVLVLVAIASASQCHASL